MTDIPSASGTYILHLPIYKERAITVGKRGTFTFPAGHYLYVGSAFGSGGLRGRLQHHLSPVTRPHWHIDYLRAVAPVQTVWYRADETRHEHQWAAALLAAPDVTVPVARFGASDCTCAAHLVHLPHEPDGAWLMALLGVSLDSHTRR